MPLRGEAFTGPIPKPVKGTHWKAGRDRRKEVIANDGK